MDIRKRKETKKGNETKLRRSREGGAKLRGDGFCRRSSPTSYSICCKRHPTMSVAVRRMPEVLRLTIKASPPANCKVSFVVQVGLFTGDRC